MTSPNLKRDPQKLKFETKYDEIKKFKIKTEKHDYEFFLKNLKIEKDWFKKDHI